MDASTIVVQFDPSCNVVGGFLSGRVDHVVDPFVLQGGEERLGERVVPANAGAAEGMPEPESVQGGPVLGRGVLRAAVGVHDTVGFQVVVVAGHLQRICDQFGAHVVGERVTDYFLVKAVDDGGQIQP